MAVPRKWIILLSVKQNHFHFIIAELRALAEMVKIPKDYFSEEKCAEAEHSYQFYFDDNDEVNESKLLEMCSRSISIYGLYELWERVWDLRKYSSL